ncbi:MAG: hypothetical protein NTV94_13645, partial [Planctomycetota bacterium]|nr:hypothetical protein [Planctomycetota bacterium]
MPTHRRGTAGILCQCLQDKARSSEIRAHERGDGLSEAPDARPAARAAIHQLPMMHHHELCAAEAKIQYALRFERSLF